MTQTIEQSPFVIAFQGKFTNMLKWEQLDSLWEKVRASGKPWYIYAVGETPPTETASVQQLETFLNEVTRLLKEEHQEDYCGIVYADNKDDPGFIKIYDPNNLGVVCGYSSNPPLPGWILSELKPTDLNTSLPHAGNRKRWWQKIFSN